MATKAKLRVVLFADKSVVAESEDPGLWQTVMRAIYAHTDVATASVSEVAGGQPDRAVDEQPPADGGDLAIAQLAKELDISVAVLKGACRPRSVSPFLRLDHHYWEAMRKGIPNRGIGSIGPIVIAGTLLALWCDRAQLAKPKVLDASRVLATINARDKNPSRALRNCEWLQLEGGRIMLNPANISRALRLARAFCTKNWADFRGKTGD